MRALLGKPLGAQILQSFINRIVVQDRSCALASCDTTYLSGVANRTVRVLRFISVINGFTPNYAGDTLWGVGCKPFPAASIS